MTSSAPDGSKSASATITYYAGKSASIVIVPSVLGGASVTKIAAQAFGHHGEIAALYLPDSVIAVEDWAFYDLNAALVISFANPKVAIDDAAFQSSSNAALYLPSGSGRASAGGKAVASAGTKAVKVELANSGSAAIAGGNYLSVTADARYAIDAAAIAAIARSASGKAADVSYNAGRVSFGGDVYVAKAKVATIAASLASAVSASELDETFRSLAADEAKALNASIASSEEYGSVASRLRFEAGYYLNGDEARLDAAAKAYDVETGAAVAKDASRGLFASTGIGKYKYVACRDSDGDGDIDILYYSPYSLSYSYESVDISSLDPNLNGMRARDRLSPIYLSFADSVLKAAGEGTKIERAALAVDTAKDGDALGAAANEERSLVWAHDYGSVSVGELHAVSSAVGNWAKMSYEAGLRSPNAEIVMEWGMNALLYATDGGRVSVGSLSGPPSTLEASGDGANGIVAGGAGAKAGRADAPSPTASAYLYNAELSLTGWNNHVADVVYGGYARLEKVSAKTGLAGSYAVGQASALANDFGNGVVEAKDFHATVYGNRSAGVYVIGGGIITAEGSSFDSKMDSGLVIASGGTLKMKDSSATGQIALRSRGGIVASSTSTFENVNFSAIKDASGYTTGQEAQAAVAAWKAAKGDSSLANFAMSREGETIGALCDISGVSAGKRAALLAELSRAAGREYTDDTGLRGSVLDNSFYNYSAGAYAGETDFSDVPFLTTGSSFGGLASSVFEFESAGESIELDSCSFENKAEADYRYLVASEAGSAPVIAFKNSKAAGIIWNEGDVERAVEGRPGARSSKLSVRFSGSDFTGSFADGSNGLWMVPGLSYTDAKGAASSLNGNYYRATANWGASASFDSSSTWTVTHDSYLGKLEIAQGAIVQPEKGYALSMTVDGVATPISAGSYSGKIVLSVKPL